MDALTHLKPGKYKLITEAGPTALFFILLLINLSVSHSCLLATDNKEAKHFSLCFMSLSCTQSRGFFFFLPLKKCFDCFWCWNAMSWIHLLSRTLLMRYCSECERVQMCKTVSYSCVALACWWISVGDGDKCRVRATVLGLFSFLKI